MKDTLVFTLFSYHYELQCRLMSSPIGTTPKVGFGQNISYVGFPKIVSNGNALSSDKGIFLANCDDL